MSGQPQLGYCQLALKREKKESKQCGGWWRGPEERNVAWGHSSPCAASAKLLKSLIHFRKQTMNSSHQQSFILSARRMPFQHGTETGWRGSPASALDSQSGVGTTHSFLPTRARMKEHSLCEKPGVPAHEHACGTLSCSLTRTHRFPDVKYKLLSFATVWHSVISDLKM